MYALLYALPLLHRSAVIFFHRDIRSLVGRENNMDIKTRKANGQGHTYKVGKSYRTVIRQQGLVITAMARTKPESQRLARLKASNALIPPKAIEEQKITFSVFFSEWLEVTHRPQIAPSTYERYLSLAYLHILPRIGTLTLSRISRFDVSQIFTDMARKELSVSSRRLVRALLSNVFKEAKSRDLIYESPIDGLKVLRADRKPTQPLGIEEVQRLLRVHEGTLMEARLHIAVLYGLRQGEALGLKWADLDEDKGTLKVERQLRRVSGKLRFVDLKTAASQRTVHLSPTSVEVLRVHKDLLITKANESAEGWQEHGLIFPNKTGMPQQSKWDYHLWKKALIRAEIEPRSLHNARHTAGTLMYANGVGIETIRRILGHASVTMTSSTYVHSAEEPLRRAAEAMSEMLWAK